MCLEVLGSAKRTVSGYTDDVGVLLAQAAKVIGVHVGNELPGGNRAGGLAPHPTRDGLFFDLDRRAAVDIRVIPFADNVRTAYLS